MGTRHQIKVINNKEVKVRQYGQWDGYLSGQGAKIASFLQENKNMQPFKEALAQCSFLSKEDIDNVNLNPRWKDDFPWLSRDAGAEVLSYIKSGDARKLPDSDEEENKRWCEYFYDINMDDETIHVEGHGIDRTFTFEEFTPELCKSLEKEGEE